MNREERLQTQYKQSIQQQEADEQEREMGGMMGLQDNENVVNPLDYPNSIGGHNASYGEQAQNGVGNVPGMQTADVLMADGYRAQNGENGRIGAGVLNSSVTTKFNNDLIHSEKDSNGKALVHNTSQNY